MSIHYGGVECYYDNRYILNVIIFLANLKPCLLKKSLYKFNETASDNSHKKNVNLEYSSRWFQRPFSMSMYISVKKKI